MVLINKNRGVIVFSCLRTSRGLSYNFVDKTCVSIIDINSGYRKDKSILIQILFYFFINYFNSFISTEDSKSKVYLGLN